MLKIVLLGVWLIVVTVGAVAGSGYLAAMKKQDGEAAELPALPFVYVFGRSHFAVSFYGANVYPENVSVGIEQPQFAAQLTGKFVLEVKEGEARDGELRLTVELARGTTGSEELGTQIADSVRRELERLNSEFANYVPSARRSPHVELRAVPFRIT